MKTAVVAGGAGFIGSHLCEYLLNKGYKVYAIDNLVTGRRTNIEHLLKNHNFNWLEMDINQSLHLNISAQEVYNLASPASPIDFERIPDTILLTSSAGHLNLLKWALKEKAKILLASTSEVYGDPLQHPQREDYLGNVDCIGVRGCYDEAKRFAEALTMAYHRKYKLETRIARIFNTYGPRMRPEDGRVIPNFFTQALSGKPLTIYGDGKQTRSLCYVSDLVEGLYKLMQSSVTAPVNLGSQNETTIMEIAQSVAAACNVEFKYEFHPLPKSDPKQRCPDTSKAKKELDWEPRVTTRDGFAMTLEYFKNV